MVEIEIVKEQKAHIIIVKGEIDASSSIDLDNAIQQTAELTHSILVDMSGLEYISSAGLGVFISYLEDLKIKGVGLALFALRPNVYEVFQILGLQNLIHIAQTKEEASKLLV
jgi:anti-sigma B factor antagonist